MRVFVFEYITGGGMLNSPLPPSLVEEGDIMLSALISDLAEIGGIEVYTTRDARLPELNLPVKCHRLDDMEDFAMVWQTCMDNADAVWPIAPEFSNVLLHISETVISHGKLLLNSPPHAVFTASSKLMTANCLADNGIPVVPTYALDGVVPSRSGSWVLKPDDGVGCHGIRICRDRDDLYQQFESLPKNSEYVIQPFVHGTPTSLNILACRGEAYVLSVNHQRIAVTDNRFVLLGCLVNGQLNHRARYHRIGQEVAAALPDLWGIIGVDLIDTKQELQVLEVNPRITTSYAGLRESTGINPAAMVLDLLHDKLPLHDQILQTSVVDVNLEYAGAA
jgi:predicted ATP-grasp superfamily ATP-dependent carboligase